MTGCWRSGFSPLPSESTWLGGSFSKGFVLGTKFESPRKKAQFASRTAHTKGMSSRSPRWRVVAARA